MAKGADIVPELDIGCLRGHGSVWVILSCHVSPVCLILKERSLYLYIKDNASKIYSDPSTHRFVMVQKGKIFLVASKPGCFGVAVLAVVVTG